LELSEIQNGMIRMALVALESVHEATYHHSIRTAKVSIHIAAKVDWCLSESDRASYLDDIRDAALLHDIGKLSCPTQILDKKESLTDRERENILCHPIWGADMLLTLPDKRLQRIARFVREHHEQPDGKGYPFRLDLDEIAPISRVINIADRFAAMTENRPYRKAVPTEVALEILHLDIKAFFGEKAGAVTDALVGFKMKPGLVHIPAKVLSASGTSYREVRESGLSLAAAH